MASLPFKEKIAQDKTAQIGPKVRAVATFKASEPLEDPVVLKNIDVKICRLILGETKHLKRVVINEFTQKALEANPGIRIIFQGRFNYLPQFAVALAHFLIAK
jgi:hypothetical protein